MNHCTVILAVLLSASLVRAQEVVPAPVDAPVVEEPRPPWRERDGFPDATTWLARKAPVSLQAPVLLGLDFLLPLVVALPAAGLGLLVGTAVGAANVRRDGSSVTVRLRLLGPVVGAVTALVGGSLALLGMDLLLNTLHLRRVAPARFVSVALVGVATAVLLAVPLAGMVLLASSNPNPPVLLAAAVALPAAVGLVTFPLAVVGALGLSTAVRLWSDYEDGSALWSRQGP